MRNIFLFFRNRYRESVAREAELPAKPLSDRGDLDYKPDKSYSPPRTSRSTSRCQIPDETHSDRSLSSSGSSSIRVS